MTWSAALQGIGDRRAGVAAVFDCAAAARAVHQAVAAASRRIGIPAARPGRPGGDWRGRGGAGRADDLAGRRRSESASSCAPALPAWPSCCTWAGRALVAGDRAAGELAVVPAAPRGAASVASGQPDARHSAGRRPRRVLHRRHPVAAGEPARRVLDSDCRRTRPTCSCSISRTTQADDVRAFLADPANGAGPSQLLPVLRARVVGIDGRGSRRTPSRTCGSAASDASTPLPIAITSSRTSGFSTARSGTAPSAEPEVSIEREIRERSRLEVGDTMRFDILGRDRQRPRDEHSRRRVARLAERRLRVRVPSGRARRGAADVRRAAQRARGCRRTAAASSTISWRGFRTCRSSTSARFSTTVRDVMAKVTLAITVVGGLVLFSGALILVGAVAMTKYQRVYEAAVFKTLGANTRHDRAHAAVRVQRARCAGRARRIGRRGRADLGRQPLCARDSVARVPRRARGRRPADGASRRRRSASFPASTCSATSRSRRCGRSRTTRTFEVTLYAGSSCLRAASW